jgi:hypothetical protein
MKPFLHSKIHAKQFGGNQDFAIQQLEKFLKTHE